MSDPSLYGGGPPPITEADETRYIAPGGGTITGGIEREVITSGTREPFRGPATRITEVVTPRYASGDEWVPQIESWPPERVADLQAQLVDAGLLDPDSYQRGYWDDESATAYRQLLGYSNVAGIDSHQTLQRIGEVKSKYGTTADKARVRQPFIAELADPAALNDLLDNVSVRLLGRALSPTEKGTFAESFRTTQESEQRRAYDMAGVENGPGGTVTMPDAESRATEFVRSNQPQEVAEYDAINRWRQFQALL